MRLPWRILPRDCRLNVIDYEDSFRVGWRVMPAKELVKPGLPRSRVGALTAPILDVARPVAVAASGFECSLGLLGVASSSHQGEACHEYNRADEADRQSIHAFNSHFGTLLSRWF